MAQALRVNIIGDARSYSKALNEASGHTSSFGKSLVALGKTAALVGGAAAVGGLFVTLKRGFGEISESQKVMAQTNAVLKSTGDVAQTSAKQVSDLATSLSRISGADDEAIQSGENMLLTFTNIRNEAGKNNDILNQTTKVLLDMATAMNGGASPSAEQLRKQAIQLGKAMQDPIKGLTALRRVGVTFTADQQKQIAALVKSGHAMEAQKLILRELNKEFGGSAKAAGQTLPGQLNRLRNSFDELAGGIAGALLPALQGALGGLTKLFDRLSQAQGFRAKIKVVASFVWTGLERAVSALRKTFSDLLFGSFSEGGGIGGVGPQGIKFNQGLVDKIGDALANLDWAAVGEAVLAGIADALRTAGDLAKQVATFITQAVRGVNWNDVGRVLGPGLAAAITAAFVTLTDPAFWVKNWDLALAVALVAFPVGKLIKPIGDLLLRGFSGEVIRLGEALAQLSPRLADAVMTGLFKLPGLVGALFRTVGDQMDTAVRAIFGRLAAIAVFTIKVLGIEAAINALTQFAVGPVWNTITNAFDTVKNAAAAVGTFIAQKLNEAKGLIEAAALRIALAIVEPFTHLPSFLGGWARDAKDAINAELGKVEFHQISAKLAAEAGEMRAAGQITARAAKEGFTDLMPEISAAAASLGGSAAAAVRNKAGEANAAGALLGTNILTGLKAGMLANLNQVIATAQYVVAQVIAAGRAAAGAQSPSKKMIELGKDMIEGLGIGLKGLRELLGTKLANDLLSGLVDTGKKAGGALIKGLGNAAPAIIAAAKKVGVDARAALAVAMTEGGTSFGAVGDKGTSFGPFQLHIGGANPYGDPKKAAEFANSIKGIEYALRAMAAAGATGKTALESIRTIVSKFERPANVEAEINKAWEFYKKLPGQLASVGPALDAAQLKNIQGLLAVIRQYAPQVGIEHVRQIVAGINLESPHLAATARAAIQTWIAEARKAVAEGKGALVDAFRQLANDIFSAFDEVTDRYVSKKRKILDKMRIEDEINSTVKAVADAQTKIDQAYAQLQADLAAGPKEGESQADFNARIEQDKANLQAATEELGAAQRSYTESQLQLQADQEETAYQTRRAKQRERLGQDLLDLEEFLVKHPEKYAWVQRQILKLLKDNQIPMYKAGKTLAELFGEGLDKGLDTVIAAAERLARALKDIQNIGKKGGGGEGGEIRVGGHFAAGGIVTRPMLAMVGEAGPEAIIPLGNMRRADGGGEVHIHIGTVIGTGLREAANEIYSELLRKQGRNATLGFT